MSRLKDAATWLATQFSATRDEFRREHQQGADMLLDGLVAHGYAREKAGRFAVTEIGRKAIAA